MSDQLAPSGSDATLASLAYINVTWEESRTSYLDNFVPFALEAFRVVQKPRNQHEVKDAILTRFGLDFPTNVVRSLLERAAKRGFVRRVPKSEAFELLPGVAEKLPDLVGQQADCRRQQGYLVRALQTFALARFEVSWDEGAAEEALVEYLEVHALPMLTSTVRGSLLAGSETLSEGRSYVVATFVAEIVANDPAGFEYLDQMIKGSMLASALYVRAKGQVSRKFKRTTLYLDTPICLRALGHEGPEAEAATQSMLGLALAEGAQLACFKHSLSEMRGVLQGVKGLLRKTPGSETAIRGVAKHYRGTGGTASDIDLAVARLEQDLERNRIVIRSTPDYTNSLGVDETRLEETLQKFVRYRDTGTMLTDLKSLTAIHRLRRGSSDAYLETCGAVLVTNNANVVKASRSFFDSGKHEWPLVMLDSTVSTLLWVKSPTTAPDLPKRQVIADCYSALAPTAGLWSKFVEEVDRLAERGVIDEDSLALLRYSHEAEQALMDVTMGDPKRVSEGAVRSTLEKARKSVAEPSEEARRNALSRAVAAEHAESESRFEAERKAAEAESYRQRLSVLEAKNSAREFAIRSRITRRATRLANCIKAIAIVVLGTSVVVGVGSLYPKVNEWVPQSAEPLIRLGALVAVVLSAATLWCGQSIRRWIQLARDGMIERALSREGLDPVNDLVSD